MKTMHKTLLITVLLAAPLAAAQAQGDAAKHRAWIEAQKIDVQPTLTVKETEIPADSGAAQTQPMPPSYNTPATQAPSTNMPAAPSTPSPDTYATPPAGGQQQPMPSHPGMGGSTGTGMQ